MLGSVKYQIEGSKLTIETGVKPIGGITRIPTSDYSAQYRDEKNNLIRIEIYGLAKVGRSETAINFGEWGTAEKVKSAKPKNAKGKSKK